MKQGWKELLAIVILSGLYVLLGNARSIQENPLIPGAVIAVNMIIPVIAGILFGWRAGLLVGLLGTMLNGFSPAGTPFDFLAAISHGIMGMTAGFLRRKLPSPIVSGTLIIGHLLNILLFYLAGLIPIGTLSNPRLWLGIIYETVVGMLAIFVIMVVYHMAIAKQHKGDSKSSEDNNL